MTAGQILKSDLSLVNLPIAGEKARVFVAIGVAQHQLLQGLHVFSNPREQLAVQAVVEQLLHHRGRALKVLHRFKQRHHEQVGMLCSWIHKAGFFGQQQHLQ